MKIKVAAACLFFVSVVLAGDKHVPHIALLVDTSGSMQGQMGLAVQEALEIVSQPVDDGFLRVWSFADDHVSWDLGWVRMPNQEAVENSKAWLSNKIVMGNTYTVRPIRKLLKEKKNKPLYIVVVTDGVFTDGVAAVGSALLQSQKHRKRPASINFVVIGEENKELEKIAKRWNGAYKVVKPVPTHDPF